MTAKFLCRVYYENTDAGGVVYHAAYLGFFERARTEMLREYGYDQKTLGEQGVLFAVRSLDIRYLQPAYLDDELEITTHIEHAGATSLTFCQTASRGGAAVAEATVRVVCVTPAPFRAQKIPSFLREKITVKPAKQV